MIYLNLLGKNFEFISSFKLSLYKNKFFYRDKDKTHLKNLFSNIS